MSLFKQTALEDSLAVYAITDRRWLHGRSLTDCVGDAIDGGATFIQLREKNLTSEERYPLAVELKKLCATAGIPFVLDDDVALARRVDADGVHVGQSDMVAQEVRRELGAAKILGVSASTVEEAVAAEAAGADYLGVGAVFPTSSKDDATVLTPEALTEICQAVTIPVVAIGGITAQNVATLRGTGIAGVAVISAIFAAPNITAATQALSQEVRHVLT